MQNLTKTLKTHTMYDIIYNEKQVPESNRRFPAK